MITRKTSLTVRQIYVCGKSICDTQRAFYFKIE